MENSDVSVCAHCEYCCISNTRCGTESECTGSSDLLFLAYVSVIFLTVFVLMYLIYAIVACIQNVRTKRFNKYVDFFYGLHGKQSRILPGVTIGAPLNPQSPPIISVLVPGEPLSFPTLSDNWMRSTDTKGESVNSNKEIMNRRPKRKGIIRRRLRNTRIRPVELQMCRISKDKDNDTQKIMLDDISVNTERPKDMSQGPLRPLSGRFYKGTVLE